MPCYADFGGRGEMRSYYDEELDRLGETYKLARSADIEQLKIAIINASEASIIGVGSGG